jgi:hypothetical protein
MLRRSAADADRERTVYTCRESDRARQLKFFLGSEGKRFTEPWNNAKLFSGRNDEGLQR